MREQLDRLQGLISFPRIDAEAVSASLHALPTDAGAEITVVTAQARRALAKVAAGKEEYKPLLRHAIKRLIVLLKERAAESQPSKLPLLLMLPRPLDLSPTATLT